jgi:hypothetical protein
MIQNRTGYRGIDRLIHRISHITWVSATPPFICAFLNLVLYLAMWRKDFWSMLYVNT